MCEKYWCDYQSALFDKPLASHHSDYLSKALIEHVGRILSEYRYNDGEFIKTLSFGMTTNHNESIHNLLFSMIPKKDRAGLDAIKLEAALAIIRYNDGYKTVYNICKSYSQSDPFKRMKEAFRLLDNKRIMNSRNPIAWKDTFAKEETHNAKLREQIAKHG